MYIDFDDFYNGLLMLVIVLLVCFGCYFLYKEESKFREQHNYREINGIRLITIDGHDYIYNGNKVVCHYESCENPSHKK